MHRFCKKCTHKEYCPRANTRKFTDYYCKATFEEVSEAYERYLQKMRDNTKSLLENFVD